MERLLNWCAEEIKMMKRQIELMENGTIRVHKYEGFKQVDGDENDNWINFYQEKIKEMESIIADAKLEA